MSYPTVARDGLIVLIAISVALWFSAAPAAAQEADDGGLAVEISPDGVQVGGEDGLNISTDTESVGSIDGGGGGGAVEVSAGGDDGFAGGGGGQASVGTDGVEVSSSGGGGDAQGNIVSEYEFGLDANTDGNVSGVGGGTIEALGEGGTLKCSFDTAEGQPSPDDCETPGTGDGDIPIPEIPNPGGSGPDLPDPGDLPGPELPAPGSIGSLLAL